MSLRRRMVETHLKKRGIKDERVLSAMLRVPRHRFVPQDLAAVAYSDRPLPLAEGQTISQPFIVALMTELLGLEQGHRVLELGTGSGYQTAILVDAGADVWSVERSLHLHNAADTLLRVLGYRNATLVLGDGTLGLPDTAPFDRILATGSMPSVPERLLHQLAPGGCFVGPIGGFSTQTLVRITYHPSGFTTETFGACRFVPLIGDEGWTRTGIRAS